MTSSVVTTYVTTRCFSLSLGSARAQCPKISPHTCYLVVADVRAKQRCFPHANGLADGNPAATTGAKTDRSEAAGS